MESICENQADPAKTLRSTTRVKVTQKKKNALAELTNAPTPRRIEESNSFRKMPTRSCNTEAAKAILNKTKLGDSPKPKPKKKKRETSKQTKQRSNMSKNKNINNNNSDDDNKNNNDDDNNNNLQHERALEEKCKLLKALCVSLDKQQPEHQEISTVGSTHIDLQQFLENSTLPRKFKGVLNTSSNAQRLEQLIRLVYELDKVQLGQLLDFYHLAFLMQQYQQLDTHCQGLRSQLLQAVAGLPAELQLEHIQYIGISLCDRWVHGTGKERMQRVIFVHGVLVQLINESAVNRDIAMVILLATFAKIAEISPSQKQTDIISQAFDMVQRVDWMQLVVKGREADMLVLLRSFALIMNTKHNRLAHPHWSKELGCDIHKFFMSVLRTVRCSSKYNAFAMMVERYIAFCIVSGSAASFPTTDVFDIGSL